MDSIGRFQFCSQKFSPSPTTMAILLKREGSPYWFAAFDVTMPDGTTRRLKKSTKRTKEGGDEFDGHKVSFGIWC